LPEPADAASLLAYYERNDARIRPWDPLRPHELGAHAAWIAERRSAGDPPNAFLAFANVAGVPELAAVVVLDGFSSAPPQAMIAYTVDGAFEGLGYASEAVAGVLQFAFDELGLLEMNAYYHPDNVRSERLVQRLGFREVTRSVTIPGMERLFRPQVLVTVDRAAFVRATS